MVCHEGRVRSLIEVYVTDARFWDYDSLLRRISNAVEAADAVGRMKSRIDTDYGMTDNWAGKPFVLGLDHRGILPREGEERDDVMSARIGALWSPGWSLSNHDPAVRNEDHRICLTRKKDEGDWRVCGMIALHDGRIPDGIQAFLRVLDIDPATLLIKGDGAELKEVRRSESAVDAAFERAIKLLINGE